MTPAPLFHQRLKETSRQHNQPPFMMLWCYFGALGFLYYLRVQFIHLIHFTIYIRYISEHQEAT